ncbi:MAG: 23S rRNA (uridine(2552)-2'-O)-methyltransferase RlmE [Cardiobacteriaceae bacterium]|nr:23S rRNA (uridine(2552)-2'-O)-methyltransferase RlmE [Cardiobacteriaceae bacterium]
MARSKSSSRWLAEHEKDIFVQKARADGWRSRAVFKLQEIQERDQIIRPKMTVVDLGAAPGGWSQYVSSLLGGRGKIIALDILPMDALPDVVFIQGDFREEEVLARLLAELDGRKADLIISDMAPNMSGVKSVDQAKSMYLNELAFDLAEKSLAQGGNFLVKVFHGSGFDDFFRNLKSAFSSVASRKPQASRDRSQEVYLLAKGFRGRNF